MFYDADSLDAILTLIKQIEAALLGLRQLRGYVGKGPGLQMVDSLIEQMEANLSEVKRRLVQ